MISKVSRLIKYTDMFYSSQMLRNEDEQEYRTITGGVLSIAIIITTIIGFASMILETLDLSTITTSMELVKNDDPTSSIFTASSEQNFMFAAQIWRVNSTGSKRYFDIALSQIIRSGQDRYFYNLPLQPCTRAHWTLIPSLSDKFDKLNIGNWLCPPIGLKLEMYGKYSSNMSSSYGLTVSRCKNQTDPSQPCASQEQIDQLFVQFQQKFFFTVFYTNPIINPSRKEYKSYYLQDQVYVIYGSNMGSQAFIDFTDYTIETDYSIWPFKNIVKDQGVLVQNHAVNHPYQIVNDGVYATVYMSKSPNSITYNRQVQKISSVFSFIGGMIGAISAILFFIKTYTHLSFEISIASSIFKNSRAESEDTEKEDSLKMNFFTFIKYLVYSIFQKLGVALNWSNIDYITRCQQEVVKQLDIKNMIKRFIFIEHCISHIIEDFQLDGLQINTPSTLEQIKHIREKCVCVLDCQNKAMERSDLIQGVRKQGKNQMENNNLDLEKLSSLQSNLQLCKRQRDQQLQPKLIIQDINDEKQPSTKKEGFEKGGHRCKKVRRIISSAVSNNSRRSMIRQTNLRLLSLNSEMGNELSKKIWQQLSFKMKLTIRENALTKKKLILPSKKDEQQKQYQDNI